MKTITNQFGSITEYDQAEFKRLQEHKNWKKKHFRKARLWLWLALSFEFITFISFCFHQLLPAWTTALQGFGIGFMFAQATIFIRQEFERFNREENDNAGI